MRFLTCIIFALHITFAFSQNNEPPVATVGKETVTTDEFKSRYELMPHVSKKWFNSDSVKAEFLYSVIAEKLWAKEAVCEGLDKSAYFLNTMKPLEKMYVRDALYKREIESKLNISNDDIQNANQRSNTTLKVIIISSPDSQKIFSLHDRLKKGVPIDSLECEKNYDEITFCKLEDEKVEDAVYALGKDHFTRPINNKSGWFIFYLKDKIIREALKADSLNLHNSSRQQLKERRAKKIGTAFLAAFLKNADASTNGRLFVSLAAKIHMALKDKQPPTKNSNSVFLGSEDIASIRKQFGSDSLNMPFLKFKKDPVSLSDFLYTLDIDGFDIRKTDLKSIMSRLNISTSSAIKNELLAREGYRRGLQNLPEVKNEIKLWRENELAQMARNQEVKMPEITETEAMEYYDKMSGENAQKAKIKIVEILTDSLQIVEKILNDSKSGRSFEEMAAAYNKRESTRKCGGEWDYFDPAVQGEIGKAASNMKTGEIYGPIKTSDGYSVIKLVERKAADEKASDKYENVSAKVKNDLAYKKMNSSYNKKTLELAKRYGVTIDADVLKSILVMNINMFTYRYMGFGGRVTAVPYTTPMYDWSKEWEKGKPSLP
jgi:parvulin-like peptidyl-prolyl isomerase